MMLKTLGSGSDGNCHVITADNGEQLMLDCGIPYRKIIRKVALNYSFRNVWGCLCTHEHRDHIRAINEIKEYGVDCYTPYDGDPVRTARWMGRYRVMAFPLRDPKTGRWLHNNVYRKKAGDECPIYGFLIFQEEGIECILYVTDCEYIPYRFTNRAISTMIIGCNYVGNEEISAAKAAHVYRGHLGLSTVKEFVRVNQTKYLRHVILCHLSADADDELMAREIKSVVGEYVTVDIAEELKEIAID